MQRTNYENDSIISHISISCSIPTVNDENSQLNHNIMIKPHPEENGSLTKRKAGTSGGTKVSLTPPRRRPQKSKDITELSKRREGEIEEEKEVLDDDFSFQQLKGKLLNFEKTQREHFKKGSNPKVDMTERESDSDGYAKASEEALTTRRTIKASRKYMEWKREKINQRNLCSKTSIGELDNPIEEFSLQNIKNRLLELQEQNPQLKKKLNDQSDDTKGISLKKPGPKPVPKPHNISEPRNRSSSSMKHNNDTFSACSNKSFRSKTTIGQPTADSSKLAMVLSRADRLQRENTKTSSEKSVKSFSSKSTTRTASPIMRSSLTPIGLREKKEKNMLQLKQSSSIKSHSSNHQQQPIMRNSLTPIGLREKKDQRKDTSDHYVTPLSTKQKIGVNQTSNSSKDKSFTVNTQPVGRYRFKPRIKKEDVQATDNSKASVQKLAKWLSDDPFEKQKLREIRKGATVYKKSQAFEDKDCSILVKETMSTQQSGKVEERRAWLNSAFEKKPQNETDSNASMSVSDKKKWLEQAFAKKKETKTTRASI